MEFIGTTALIDAGIAILAWVVLYTRKKDGVVSNKMQALSSYLLATFFFLVLIAFTILKTSGVFQQVMFLVSDLVLWVSLIAFISLMYSDVPGGNKKVLITLFSVFALMRTLFQLAGIIGVDISGLGSSMLYALSQLDAWLMYVVWVPSALYLIGVALKADSSVVRARALMFAIGLLLITFTWAFRLLAQASVTEQTGFILVSGASLVGFVLLLAGVLYRGKEVQMVS